MEMYSQWQRQKADSRCDKIGLPEDGERKQILVDDFNVEAAGSQLREAKDLVHTLASSQTAQSTLANVARSASGLHSRQGTTAQSFHADLVSLQPGNHNTMGICWGHSGMQASGVQQRSNLSSVGVENAGKNKDGSAWPIYLTLSAAGSE
jgi:hypothetical protein